MRASTMRVAGWVVSAVVAVSVHYAWGSDLPPWRDADDLPLADGVRSATVLRPETSIMAEPSVGGARRGTAEVGVKLPVFGAKRGVACAARWINVGPEAWICQDGLTLEDRKSTRLNSSHI